MYSSIGLLIYHWCEGTESMSWHTMTLMMTMTPVFCAGHEWFHHAFLNIFQITLLSFVKWNISGYLDACINFFSPSIAHTCQVTYQSLVEVMHHLRLQPPRWLKHNRTRPKHITPHSSPSSTLRCRLATATRACHTTLACQACLIPFSMDLLCFRWELFETWPFLSV